MYYMWERNKLGVYISLYRVFTGGSRNLSTRSPNQEGADLGTSLDLQNTNNHLPPFITISSLAISTPTILSLPLDVLLTVLREIHSLSDLHSLLDATWTPRTVQTLRVYRYQIDNRIAKILRVWLLDGRYSFLSCYHYPWTAGFLAKARSLWSIHKGSTVNGIPLALSGYEALHLSPNHRINPPTLHRDSRKLKIRTGKGLWTQFGMEDGEAYRTYHRTMTSWLVWRFESFRWNHPLGLMILNKRGTRGRNSVDESCQKGGTFSQKSKGLVPYDLMPLKRIGTPPQYRSKWNGRLLGASAIELGTAVSRKHSCNRLRNLIFPAHLEERSHESSWTWESYPGHDWDC